MTKQEVKTLSKKILRKRQTLKYGVLALVIIIAAVSVVQIIPGHSARSSAAGDTLEIWNWDDLSRVMDEQAGGVTNFVVMQDIGVPDAVGTYGDGTGCTVHTGNEVYGWYGYEGYEGDPLDIGNTATFASWNNTALSHGWDPAAGWMPIGSSTTNFTSTFDGNGKTITGLWIDSTADYRGLFGVIGGAAAVTDLTIASPTGNQKTIQGGSDVGGFVGHLMGTAVLNNLYNGTDADNGVNVSGVDSIGGIVGLVDSGTLGESGGILSNTGTITGTGMMTALASTSGVGGIIGRIANNSKPTITAGSTLTNAGAIYAGTNGGGIIGKLGVGSLSGPTIFSDTPYSGSVTISNTGSVTATGNYAGGFIGYCDCNNLTLANYTNTATISGAGMVGGVIGFFTTGHFGVNGGTISNTGDIIGTGQGVGGVLGRIDGEGANAVYGSTLANAGVISGGGTYVGGVIGYVLNLGNYGAVTFSNEASATTVGVSNTASVSGAGDVGGLFGYVTDSDTTITNYVNTSPVTSTGDYAGGIVGYMFRGTITTSYNTGAVTATGNYAGGIFGDTDGGTLADLYNLGSVTGNIAGGIAGQINLSIGSIGTSYNAGKVSGPTAGGFAGNYVKGSVSNCYFDQTTSQTSDAAGNGVDMTGMVAGLPTLGFASDSTLPAGFSGTVWLIGSDGKITYPYLAWQIATGESNNIDFTSIQPAADTEAASNNPVITVTLPSAGAATKVFNAFGTNFAALTAGTANAVNTTATEGTPVSVGVMSESGIVAFDPINNIVPPVPTPTRYYITAVADSGSTIEPSGTVSVQRGNSQTFTFSANSGYHIVSVFVDGVAIPQDQIALGSYTFSNVVANHLMQVTSTSGPGPTAITLTIDITPQNGGSAEYSLNNGQTFTPYTGTVTVPAGSNVAVKADPADGYTFEKWVNGSAVTTASVLSLGTLSSSVHLALYFTNGQGGGDGHGNVWWWIIGAIILLLLIGLLLWFLLFWRRYYDVIKPSNVTGNDKVHRKGEYTFTVSGSAIVSYRVGDDENAQWKVLPPSANGEYVIPKGEITDDVTIDYR